MNYIEFLKLVDTRYVSSTEKTLRLWHVIYDWVLQHGYADTADTPDFIKHINTFRKCSVPTLSNHLRRMADAGLLKRNVLRRKLTADLKEDLSIASFLFAPSTESIPTSFVRYCLPNDKCSTELKSAEVAVRELYRKGNLLRESTTNSQPM